MEFVTPSLLNKQPLLSLSNEENLFYIKDLEDQRASSFKEWFLELYRIYSYLLYCRKVIEVMFSVEPPKNASETVEQSIAHVRNEIFPHKTESLLELNTQLSKDIYFVSKEFPTLFSKDVPLYLERIGDYNARKKTFSF